MQGPPRRLDPRPSRSLRDEAGFALIEVMVSAVLLVVLSLATLKVLDQSQKTGSNNRARDVAAQLAQSDQDKIRQMPISALAGGYHDVQTPTVGQMQYTVTSDAEWVQDSGGPVTCSTSGSLSYLQTTTTVTWDAMGSIKPVTADAIVDPGVAALGANKGALTVLLTRVDGTGAQGVTVTAEGMSSVTDENGCAVIGNLDAGTQVLSYNDPAFVDKDSNGSVTRNVTIGAGTISQATGSYDNPGYIDVRTVDDQSTPQLYKWPQVSLDHSSRSTPTLWTKTADASGTTRFGAYPFPSAYKAYAGNCTGNDPANALYTNAGAGPGAQVDRGQTKAVDVTLRRVTVNFGSTATAANTKLIAEPETAAPPMAPASPAVACTGTFTITPSSVDASGNFTFALPYGVWEVCGSKKMADGKFQQQATVNWVAGSTATNRPLVVTTPSTTGTYKANTTASLPFSGTTGTQSSDFTSCP